MNTVLSFALLSWNDTWLLMVAWLLVSLGKSQAEAKPVIWEHFTTDDCDSLPGNVSRQVPFRTLLGEGFFLQLDIYGTYTPRLLAARADPCILPGSEMYRVKEGKKYKQHFEVLFEAVPPVMITTGKEKEEEESAEKGEEEGERKETPRTLVTKCNFPIGGGGGYVRLKSGYGFLSCRGENDVGAARAALQTWQKDVRGEETKAAATKVAVMGGIGGGMTALVLLCLVCVLMRLRATRGRERSRRTRRLTPPRSASTRITNDQVSSTQQSALNSRSGNTR
ncbi:uncharacterized protein LOC122243988 [Penaeus japonicus]|uniref:uncharacterized protein LOC122243988 n=1 Tax=Penaeus japonicus TaxID=27405 RepID=UPI001C7103CD|nr:uncharacterized protein LOC122243988 [Penaeus japonicus]